jgi:hypothetical protein
MARIPIGIGEGDQLGRSIADPQGAVRVDPAAFGAGVGAAAGDAVNAFAREVGAERRQEAAQAQADQRQADAEMRAQQRQAAAEAKQAEAERRRIAQLTARAEVTNELDTLHTQIATGIADGSVPRADGVTRWQAESETRINAALERFDPGMQDLVRAELLGARNRLGLGVQQAATRRAQSETGAQLLQLGEQYQRMALTDRGRAVSEFEGALATFGPAAGLNPEQIQTQRQGFRERVAFDVGSALVRGARNDLRALDQVGQRLGSDEFADLDPGRRGQLEAQLVSRREQILAANERAAAQAARANEARQAAAGRSFEALDRLTLSGAVPDAAFAAQVTAATRGTPFEQAARQVIETAAARANFAALPLPQQRAALLAAQSDANAGGTNPQAAARVDLLQRTVKQTEDAIAADPLRAGLDRGWIREVAPLNVTDLASLPAALGQRVEAARTVAGRAGRAVSPLLAEEAEGVRRLVETLAPRDRVTALAPIVRGMPPEQIRAMAGQVNEKSPALAGALLAMAADRTTNRGRPVAELIMTGDDLLRTKSVKIDPNAETGARTRIRQELRGAFATQAAEDAAVESTFRVYATLLNEGRDDTRAAVRLTTGGVFERNGAKAVRRWGWTDDDMQQAISQQIPATLEARSGGALAVGGERVTADDLYRQRNRWQLGGTAASGAYTVSLGGRIVTRADGSPFTVQLWNE